MIAHQYIYHRPLLFTAGSLYTSVHSRRDQAVAITLLAVYSFLLFLCFLPFCRILLHHINFSTDSYVPLPQTPYSGSFVPEDLVSGKVAPPPGLDEFFIDKDVFLCDRVGLPRWCRKCSNWKPDRAHHCKQLNRCVRRMDHYCPWIGGVVGESNHKFFLLFVVYSALFAAFAIGVGAWGLTRVHDMVSPVAVSSCVCLVGNWALTVCLRSQGQKGTCSLSL